MTEKQISPDFSAKAGERELEIFLLSDSARKEWREMQKDSAEAGQKLRTQQQARQQEDIRAAARTIRAERHKPELAPDWRPARKQPKETEVQREALRRVESKNAVAQKALAEQHRVREDAFLAAQKTQRVEREAQAQETRNRSPPAVQRDFDRAR